MCAILPSIGATCPLRACARNLRTQCGPNEGGDTQACTSRLRESESFDGLLRRFTKGIERSGIIREHRRGLRFISVQEENRAKRRKAERRRRRNST